MSKMSIDNYAATLAIAVGQQEAALHRPQRPQRPLGIENCATGNCQNQSMGAVPDNGRPWWFWLAVGAGVGGLVYMASKSGLHRNPDDEGAFEIAQRAAAISVQAGIPTILWGSPGIGKTSWLESLGQAMDAEVFTVIGSTKDPADIGGMMKLDGSLTPPMWARKISERSLKGLRSVLFLDEFSSMAPLVHAALLRVVRDKIAGEWDFDPKNGPLRGNAVHVVCAANPRSEGAAAIDLPPPAANRMLHIDWPVPPATSWALGIITGKFPTPKLDALPLDWRKMPEVKYAKKDIAAFLSYASENVLKVPKESQERGRSWPSPRSWEMASDVLGAARIVGASRRIEIELLGGSVGALFATKFFRWLDETKEWFDKSRLEVLDLLKDAKGLTRIESYSRPDRIMVIGRQIVAEVREHPTQQTWSDAWKLIEYAVTVSEEGGELQFLVAPFAVMASDLLSMLNDPRYRDKLKGAKLPDEALLAALDYEDVQVRARR